MKSKSKDTSFIDTRTSFTIDENEDDDQNEVYSMSNISNHNGDETPNFTDDEIEDVSDEFLCPDLLIERPEEDQHEKKIVIVDGLPIVDNVKLTKLQIVIKRMFQSVGTILNDSYPLDNEGKTQGFAFFEFENEEIAMKATRRAHGYRLDRSHTLSAILMSQFDALIESPKKSSNDVVENEDFYSWLREPNAIDQFAVQIEEREKILIYENSRPMNLILDRLHWSAGMFNWSPRGTFLASFHPEGIILWAGNNFRLIKCYSHIGVTQIEFSPCERFLVTSSFHPSAQYAWIIWDVRIERIHDIIPFEQLNSTVFKWSFDGEYFVVQRSDGFNICRTESNRIISKIPSVVTFQWSTSDHRFVYWTNADQNRSARLILAEISENEIKEIRSKPLINVIHCQFVWQTSGDYLIVEVQRYTKKNGEKSNRKYSRVISNFEIFYLRQRDVPLDTLEVKETVQSFSIEPVGQKFTIITGDDHQTSVTFYRISPNQKIEIIGVVAQPVTHALWSPFGQFVVLASRKTTMSNDVFFFVDSNDLNVVIKQEHPFLSDLEWDPTGRYIATWSTISTTRRDQSLKIWTLDSREFVTKHFERLMRFCWRPRPRSLLTDQMIKVDIQQNRSSWTQRFAREDRLRNLNVSLAIIEERRRKAKEFETIRTAIKERRLRLQNQRNLIEDSSYIEETIEILIDSKEIEYKNV